MPGSSAPGVSRVPPSAVVTVPVSIWHLAPRRKRLPPSKSRSRSPSYRYARMVRPSTTSGDANSDDGLGRSLPTNGTARRMRPFTVSLQAPSESNRPYSTRLRLLRMCGRRVTIHWRARFKRATAGLFSSFWQKLFCSHCFASSSSCFCSSRVGGSSTPNAPAPPVT